MADTPLLQRQENTQSPQEGTSGAPGAGESTAPAGGMAITPELVAQVAARVYQLWLADMRIEKERQRK